MATSPEPSQLSSSSRRLLDALRPYCSLAWPIMKTQCELAHLDPTRLLPSDLERVVPMITTALARFTSEDKSRRFAEDVLGASSRPTALGTSGSPPRLFSHDGGGAPASAKEPTLTGFPADVLGVLKSVSPLAWPMLQTQCSKAGFDPIRLAPGDLVQLLPALHSAVARFASASKADRVLSELKALASDARV